MKTPITYAKAQVFRPGFGLAEHSKIQQHVGVLAQEPDFKNKIATIVIRKADLKRLFGDEVPREFYLSANGVLTYVALKAETGMEGNDRFADAIALNATVLSAIFGGKDDIWVNEPNMPWLRFIVLANEIEIEALAINDRIVKIEKEEFLDTNVMFQWGGGHRWIAQEAPIEAEPEQEKPKIHLKDIPLNNRSGRRMVRKAIEDHRETLEAAHVTSGSQLSFDEWMVENQKVNVIALQQLAGIDALPDDEYVDAMVKFKQAEVTGYYNVAKEKGQTDKHLFDWCVENFGEEFQHVGRKDAQAEIDMMAIDPEVEDDSGEVDEPAVFVVSFDGTIVENQRPTIGAESPFAIATLKALKKNGHAIFIFSGRKGDERKAMLDFMAAADFTPHGIVKMLMPDDVITTEDTDVFQEWHPLIDKAEMAEGLPIDYVIDHKQFNAAFINITGKGAPTFFWGDLIDQLNREGYLTDENVGEIKDALTEQAEKL